MVRMTRGFFKENFSSGKKSVLTVIIFMLFDQCMGYFMEDNIQIPEVNCQVSVADSQ